MPSPVDWSEFNVWCYMLADEQKRKMKSIAAQAKKTYGVTGAGAKAKGSLEVFCPSCIVKSYNTCILSSKIGDVIDLAQKKRGFKMGVNNAVQSAYVQFAAGALGGSTATYATHWLDTIKVKMQTFPQMYGSSMCCLKDTVRTEGVRGLYCGAMPALVGQTTKAAVTFMSYGLCQELVKFLAGREKTSDLTVVHHATAGAMTGVLASLFLCPMELVKCRLQALQQLSVSTEGHLAAQRAPLLMTRQILGTEGVRGLYRGLTGIWAKDIPGAFIYFGSYEMAKSLIRSVNNKTTLNNQEVFLCGVYAGLMFCVTFPLECVRTRVQVMSAVSETTGFISTLRHILKTEGVKPLCSGLKPSVVRACAYSGIQFLTYEMVKDFFMPEEGAG